MFKCSPTKNDVLQKYVKNEFGRKIELDGDCKTRWSSLAVMVEKFNKLKLCIAKTLIDLGLSTNIEYRFSQHEFDALVNLENILKPVKLAVEVLCRQDASLITAEATLKFMIKKLEDDKSALASELALCLRRRISQRRTNLTALLIYLQNPCNYCASYDDETFCLPAKNVLRKQIIDLVTRMKFSIINLSEAESNDEEGLVPVQGTNNSEEISPSNSDLTLQQELELTISSACICNAICPSPSRANSLESIIKKELTLYESGGSMGQYLTFTYKALKGIPPTSVEAERAFSAAGYIASKIRSSLADDTLDMLCFLRKYFQLNDNKMTNETK